MLARQTNFILENQTAGAGLTVQVTYCRWKFGTDGALTYEAAPSTLPISNNTDNSVGVPTGGLDNTTDLWLGMHATVSVSANVGGGDWYLYLAIEADGANSATAPQVMLVAGTGSTLVYQFEL